MCAREKSKMKNEKLLVVKANSLIQKSRYKLSLQEQKIILYLISKIMPNDTELKEYKFSVIEFCELCGIDYQQNKQTHAYIKQVIKNLADKSEWIELDEVETLIRWIAKARITKRSGIITIKLDEDLMPYLLELKKNYTKYQLQNIIPMKSKYGIRLYELLKSYLNLGKVRFSIEELKIRLDSTNYTNLKDFKRRVLEPALKDIEVYSDLTVEPVFIKAKNKCVAIEFILH